MTEILGLQFNEIMLTVIGGLLNALILIVLTWVANQIKRVQRKLQLQDIKQEAMIYSLAKWMGKPEDDRNEKYFFSCYDNKVQDLIEQKKFIN